jgi:hypothetical protein
VTRALLGLLVVLSVPARADDVEQSKEAEARAFAAIDEERWCDAMHAFLDANGAAPSVDLIYNAALAADEAQDRKSALKLYVELLGAYPDSDRGAAVNQRIGDLTNEVQESGDGTPCPEPPAPEPAEPATVQDEVTPVAEAEPPADPPGATNVLPWSVAGAGALVAVTGGVLAAVGALPYFDFVDARGRILEAESAGADASELQDRQTAASDAWGTWGALTAVSGAVLTGVGVLLSGGGVVWGLMGSGQE